MKNLFNFYGKETKKNSVGSFQKFALSYSDLNSIRGGGDDEPIGDPPGGWEEEEELP